METKLNDSHLLLPGAPTIDTKTTTFGHAQVYGEHLPGRFHPLIEGAKQPRMKAWQDGASADPARLQVLELSNQRSNLGFVPDETCFVLDIDSKGDVDGFASLAVLEARFGALPKTLRATTPNGGEHMYFRVPKGSGARTCAKAGGYAGLDIRAGDTGYVVMPPSRLPEGEYRWLNWPDLSQAPHIVAAPAWLITLAQDRDPLKPAKAAAPTRGAADGDDPDLLEHLADALQYLDSGDYDTWIAIGHALKTLPDDAGLALWLSWSSSYPGYDERDARKRWSGFRPEDSSYKVVFSRAQDAGWENPGRPRSELDKAIDAFNEKHAVVLISGSSVITQKGFDSRGNSTINFLNSGDARTFYKNRTVPVPTTLSDGQVVMKPAPLYDTWLKHPDRRSYYGITCAPGSDAPDGFLNTWCGLAVEPLPISTWKAARKCRRFLRHLRRIICCGNRYHYRYLLAWLADLVQRPDRKQGVALVMRGEQGTGKSKLAENMAMIFGGHAFKASKAHQIVGHFNSHLLDKILIVAEESFFAGSNADNGTLKDLVTSPSITIEPKGLKAFEAPSHHRVMMLTNKEWAVPATNHERRFFVLDVSEDRMQDFDYFAAIDDEMIDSDGRAAFLRVLLNIDLSGINLRKIPQTKALEKQKRLSLEPHDSFILDALSDGEICATPWDEETRTPLRGDVYDAYVAYARARSVRPITSNRFAPIFEARTGAVSFQPGSGDRRRRYELPPLSMALRRFNAQIGVSGSDE